MIQLLLKASNSESELRDDLWNIFTFTKNYTIQADEWQLLSKLNDRIVNLNEMMVQIMGDDEKLTEARESDGDQRKRSSKSNDARSKRKQGAPDADTPSKRSRHISISSSESEKSFKKSPVKSEPPEDDQVVIPAVSKSRKSSFHFESDSESLSSMATSDTLSDIENERQTRLSLNVGNESIDKQSSMDRFLGACANSNSGTKPKQPRTSTTIKGKTSLDHRLDASANTGTELPNSSTGSSANKQVQVVSRASTSTTIESQTRLDQNMGATPDNETKPSQLRISTIRSQTPLDQNLGATPGNETKPSQLRIYGVISVHGRQVKLVRNLGPSSNIKTTSLTKPKELGTPTVTTIESRTGLNPNLGAPETETESPRNSSGTGVPSTVREVQFVQSLGISSATKTELKSKRPRSSTGTILVDHKKVPLVRKSCPTPTDTKHKMLQVKQTNSRDNPDQTMDATINTNLDAVSSAATNTETTTTLTQPNTRRFKTIESAFNEKVFTLCISNESPSMPAQDFLHSSMECFKNTFEKYSRTLQMFIVYTTLHTHYIRYIEQNDESRTILFRVRPRTLNTLLSLDEWFETNISTPIWSEVSQFHDYSSGWTLKQVSKLTLHVSSYSPLKGSGQMTFKLPRWLASKRSVINIENPNDNECFKWAVLASLTNRRKPNPGRISHYKNYENLLNFSGISFPVAMSDYTKFELQNNVSINVFTVEKQPKEAEFPYLIVPIYMTVQRKELHANILLMHDGIDDDRLPALNGSNSATELRFHYCGINSLSRLLVRQTTKSKSATHFCDSCLRHSKVGYTESHKSQCLAPALGLVTLPEKKDNAVPFTCNRTFKPFVMYVHALSHNVDAQSPGELPKEIISSIGYFFRSNVGIIPSFYKSDRSTRSIEWFWKELKSIENRVYGEMKKSEVKVLPKGEFVAERCYTCGHDLAPFQTKSRLWCHFTGQFLGLVHRKCKSKYGQANREIVVVFHGLSQRVVKQLLLAINTNVDGAIQISTSNDKVMFTKEVNRLNTAMHISFRFIDSSLWLDAPLDQLVSYLPRAQLPTLRDYLLQPDPLLDEQIETICALKQESNILPPSMLRIAQRTLPDKSDFPSAIAYDRTESVWKSFQLKTRGELLDLCLKTSVLQLTDVFENFRQMCTQKYHLDAANHASVSDMAWNSMVHLSGIRLKLLTDMDQITFVEQGMRGGVAYCSYLHAKANYPEMGDQYDPQLPVDNLLCLRANDLYGSAMMEYLPESHFKWHDAENLDVLSVADDSPEGYILEVDLKYPSNLHYQHSDYPFCPELTTTPDETHKQFVLSLAAKSNYVLHYRTLKLALQNGLILKRIHKCLKFKQSPWLRPFIQLNIPNESDNKFNQFISKLMIKSVFEKLQEDPWMRSDISWRKGWPLRYGVKNVIANPYFESRIILDDSNVVGELRNRIVTYNTPNIVRMAVLELAKCVGYNFHYRFMQQHGALVKVRLLYVDTDTFIYRIRDQNVLETIQTNLSTRKAKTSLERFRNVFPSTRILEYTGKQGKIYSITLDRPNKTNKNDKVKDDDATVQDQFWCLKKI